MAKGPLHMNPRIQLQVRNADCSLCRMAQEAVGSDVCVTANGSHTARVLVVSKVPWSERNLKEMHTYLTRAGFNLAECAFTSAIKCRVWGLDSNKTDLKACKPYLEKEIGIIEPEIVIALGNEALTATAGKSGIMKHRGVTYDGPHGCKVIATISPAMVHRNPGQKAGFEADLRYIAAVLSGRDLKNEHFPPVYKIANTKADLKALCADLDDAHGVSFDIESNGFDEFADGARVVCISFTLWDVLDDEPQTTWSLPLYHPESVWKSQWRSVLKIVGKHMNQRKRIAHNGKFDCRWLRQFGWPNIDITFDTMLAAHCLDENRPKGLKPLAQSLLGAPPWAISTKDLLSDPLDEVLEYCALDTFHAARLYFLFRNELLKKQNAKKARLFQRLLVPAANEFIETERHGVWVDRPKMMENWAIAQDELTRIDAELRQWVPEEHPHIKRLKSGVVKSDGVNFGPSDFLRWFVFEHLGLPILARGKAQDDGTPGKPSVSEAVMLALQGRHPAVDLLLERTKWYKYSTAFFSAYVEQLDEQDRIHTNFKVTGTVTGRLSSGKTDADKVTSRVQIRGVNLQQVPRDNLVRGIFGAPPGFKFVEFDYSQIELRIAAYLAREKTMLGLYQQGADIHRAMACRITGKPSSEITSHERKMAKAVNFGFLYGMGATKFLSTALSNYGLHVTQEDAQAARTAFFDQFPELLPWHARQRALVRKYKRVQTPFGRVRHLPDIDSKDHKVAAEAERQAINSPVQGFASDLALLSFVLSSKRLRDRGLRAFPIGTVHDAINFQIPDEELPIALPIIKKTMENLPIQRLFGISLDIPLIADCKVGTRWGGAQELTDEQVMNFDLAMLNTEEKAS